MAKIQRSTALLQWHSARITHPATAARLPHRLWAGRWLVHWSILGRPSPDNCSCHRCIVAWVSVGMLVVIVHWRLFAPRNFCRCI